MTNMRNELNKGIHGQKWLYTFAVSSTSNTPEGISGELRCISSI